MLDQEKENFRILNIDYDEHRSDINLQQYETKKLISDLEQQLRDADKEHNELRQQAKFSKNVENAKL